MREAVGDRALRCGDVEHGSSVCVSSSAQWSVGPRVAHFVSAPGPGAQLSRHEDVDAAKVLIAEVMKLQRSTGCH